MSYPEAPFLSTTELPLQNTHTTGERRRDRRARPRCQRVRGTCQGTRGRWQGQGGPRTRRIVLSTTGPTGVEGAGRTGGPGRGAGRRRRGQAAVLVGGSRAWLRCPWAAAGPGRASRRRAERSSRRGRLAGGPPPTGTPSSPDRQHTRGARNTSGATSNTTPPRMRKPRPADAGRGFRYPVGYEV